MAWGPFFLSAGTIIGVHLDDRAVEGNGFDLDLDDFCQSQPRTATNLIMMRPADRGLMNRTGDYGRCTDSGELAFFSKPGFCTV